MDLIVYGTGAILILVFAIMVINSVVEPRKYSSPLPFMALVAVGLILIAYNCNVFGDKFKAGDCIQMQTNLEKWEKPSQVSEKVLEVGKDKYRTVIVMDGIKDMPTYGSFLIESSRYISLTDNIFDKVECPAILKEYK